MPPAPRGEPSALVGEYADVGHDVGLVGGGSNRGGGRIDLGDGGVGSAGRVVSSALCASGVALGLRGFSYDRCLRTGAGGRGGVVGTRRRAEGGSPLSKSATSRSGGGSWRRLTLVP